MASPPIPVTITCAVQPIHCQFDRLMCNSVIDVITDFASAKLAKSNLEHETRLAGAGALPFFSMMI